MKSKKILVYHRTLKVIYFLMIPLYSSMCATQKKIVNTTLKIIKNYSIKQLKFILPKLFNISLQKLTCSILYPGKLAIP